MSCLWHVDEGVNVMLVACWWRCPGIEDANMHALQDW